MKKPLAYFLILNFFLCSSVTFAQSFADQNHYLVDSLVIEELSELDQKLVDSCLTMYHESKEDSDRVYAIEIISENTWDLDLTTKYNTWLSEYIKDKLKENLDAKTKFYLEEAFARTLSGFAYVYMQKGDVVNALKYFTECLELQEKLGSKYDAAISLANIGYVYDSQGDFEKGLEYYELALAMQRETGNEIGVATSLNNIGLSHYKLGDIEKGLAYFLKSLEVQERIENIDGMALCYNNIGGIYRKKGDLKKGIEYYIKSLKLHEEMGDLHGTAHCLNNLGESYLLEGNMQQAKKYGLKGLKVAKELESPVNIRQTAKLLSDIYIKQNNGMGALEMFKLHIVMRDSIDNLETQKATAKQQIKYEYEKQKTIDDAEHDKQLAIEKEEKEKQQILTVAIGIGLLLVVIFLVFIFNRLKITRKQKTVIEDQKFEVEEAHAQLEEKNQEIMDSISYAKRIQSAILPPRKLVKEYLQESFILYKPKDVVAGDFYWMEPKGGKVLFAAADCTGHGVPGAMVSVVCNNGLNRAVREHGLTDPGAILDKTREIVIQEFEKSEEEVKDGMDIALCSLEGNILEYAGANNPLWIIRKGKIIEVKADKQPIGKFEKAKPFTTHKIELEKGDAIYIFSDGYVDQFGGIKGKKFKTRAYRELLLSIQNKSMEEQKTIIDEGFETWKGDLDQIDDVCVIGVKI